MNVIVERGLLEHCAAVMRGVGDLCQPKPRQAYDDPTEHYGGQALEELANCREQLLNLTTQAEAAEAGDVGLAVQLQNLVMVLKLSYDPHISDEDIAAVEKAADALATTPQQAEAGVERDGLTDSRRAALAVKLLLDDLATSGSEALVEEIEATIRRNIATTPQAVALALEKLRIARNIADKHVDDIAWNAVHGWISSAIGVLAQQKEGA